MIKPLRQAHRRVWFILALLLPTGIIISWLAIPNTEPVKLLQSEAPVILPIIESAADRPAFRIQIRTDEQKRERQLVWINKLELTVPSAVIYQSPDTSFEIQHAKLIGRIEARGDYVFKLDTSFKSANSYFILYDFIHQQVIDQIKLTP